MKEKFTGKIPSFPQSLALLDVVLDLLGGQNPEPLTIILHNADFYVIFGHLALETFTEGQDLNMDLILNLQSIQLVLQPLLQEGLHVLEVLADLRLFPSKIGSRGIDLEELGPTLIIARHHHGDAEGSHTTGLRKLLHHVLELSRFLAAGDFLPVGSFVLNLFFPPRPQQNLVVSGHALIHRPHAL